MDSLLARIEQRVTQAGEQPCFVMGGPVTIGNAVSYAQLWRQARQVAAFLQSYHLSKGDRVALVADNSPEYAAVFYGVLLAGGVVVPMNTSAKLRDFDNWMAHCGARLAFVDFTPREMQKLLQEPRPTRFIATNRRADGVVPDEWKSALQADWDTVLETNPVAAATETTTDTLACLIYTSGTTGNPKGVMISHGNLLANVESILAALPIQPGDRFLNVLPFYYSYGNSVLHTHLVQGATLYLENSLMYPNAVVARLQSEAITGFAGVPSTFALLLSRGKVTEHDLSSLRYVLQAGGAMAVPLIREVQEKMSRSLYVMYGQTEATARLTCLPASQLDAKMGSVGLPIPGVTIEVRRSDGTLCAADEEGELHARGGNVAQGYWDNPAATAETFVDGWLKTGDLGRADADGFLYLLGRRSDMIKSGANRISPLEIEEVINEIPSIEEVAVLGMPDAVLGQTIAAFVVMKPNQTLDVRAIKKYCLDNLASYKIPKQILAVDALPKTASGKIQKHRLAELIEEKS
ncbi:MAG TPA: class I adenylate-forming enzyme family protein [Dongiaceae bacterium]|nr:class I adenylate-forming enzyme family protein [Dongiaceae bacterium]